MEKQIKIGLGIDSDFDKVIGDIQRKFKEITAPVDLMGAQIQAQQKRAGQGISISAPTQEEYRKATSSARRELDRSIQNEVKANEKLVQLHRDMEKTVHIESVEQNKIIERLKEKQSILSKIDKERDPKKWLKAEKDVLDTQKEQDRTVEKIARAKDAMAKSAEAYKQRDKAIDTMFEAKERMKPQGIEKLMESYKEGGIKGILKEGGSMLGKLSPAAMAGIVGEILSGIGSAGQLASNVYGRFGRAPIETELAQGNAIQNTTGRDVQNIYSRRTAFEANFSKERAKAAKMSLDAMANARNKDLLDIGSQLLISGGSGMAKGAVWGTGIGAVAGGLLGIPAGPAGIAAGAMGGSRLGGMIGAAGGALLSAGGSAAEMLSDPRKGALLMSPFSNTMKQNYQAQLIQQAGQDYLSTLEAEKKQNPFKTMAIQDYEQNAMRNLQFQRSIGLTNKGFYGNNENLEENIDRFGTQKSALAGDQRLSFLQRAHRAGFTDEMAMEASQNILGAGGSTRMAQESVFGLRAARGNMTNANQVLGTLSSSMGGAAQSEQAFIKILKAGMSQGLDDSNYAEENRKFTQITAQFIAQSGVKTSEEAGKIAERFSDFNVEKTTRGIESAKNAYEEYQARSSETTGPRGVMRAAGILRDPVLSKLSVVEQQALMTLDEQDISEDNPLASGYAKKLGITVDELRKKIVGVNTGAESRFGRPDTATARLKKLGVDAGRFMSDKQYKASLPDDVREKAEEDITAIATYQTVDYGKASTELMKSRIAGRTGGKDFRPEVSDKAAEYKYFKGADQTGKMEDNLVSAMAGDAKTVLKNFNEMRGGMDEAAKAASMMKDSVRELAAALSKAAEDALKAGKSLDTTDITRNFLEKTAYQTPKSSTQPQSGKVGY